MHIWKFVWMVWWCVMVVGVVGLSKGCGRKGGHGGPTVVALCGQCGGPVWECGGLVRRTHTHPPSSILTHSSSLVWIGLDGFAPKVDSNPPKYMCSTASLQTEEFRTWYPCVHSKVASVSPFPSVVFKIPVSTTSKRVAKASMSHWLQRQLFFGGVSGFDSNAF